MLDHAPESASPTAPATPSRSIPGHRDDPRSRQSPSSASASATNCSRWHAAQRRSSSSLATAARTAGAAQTGQSKSPHRTTDSPSTRTRCRAASKSPTAASTTAQSKASPTATSRLQRAVHPEASAGPRTTAATCSAGSARRVRTELHLAPGPMTPGAKCGGRCRHHEYTPPSSLTTTGSSIARYAATCPRIDEVESSSPIAQWPAALPLPSRSNRSTSAPRRTSCGRGRTCSRRRRWRGFVVVMDVAAELAAHAPAAAPSGRIPRIPPTPWPAAAGACRTGLFAHAGSRTARRLAELHDSSLRG